MPLQQHGTAQHHLTLIDAGSHELHPEGFASAADLAAGQLDISPLEIPPYEVSVISRLAGLRVLAPRH